MAVPFVAVPSYAPRTAGRAAELARGAVVAGVEAAPPRRLKLAVLAALDQRVSTRYTITGMGAKDTTDYIRQHLTFAGRSDPLFSDDAIHAIHQASRGYPRAVNNLAVASLIATYAADKAIVDLAAAQSAITENSE